MSARKPPDSFNKGGRTMDEEIRTEVKFVEVTWKRALRVWWSFVWRGILFGFLGGAVVGFILGFIMGGLGVDSNTIRTVCQISGGVVGFPIGIVVTKIVLKKKYSDFRIALIGDPK